MKAEMTGWGYFKAFTIDANILNGVIALIVGGFDLKWLLEKRNSGKTEEIPRWVGILRLVGATNMLVVFLTVLLFLIPVRIGSGLDAGMLVSNEMVFFHIFNPLVAAAGFIFLQKQGELKDFEKAMAVLPLALYIIIYAIMVFGVKSWTDFYGLTFGGNLVFGLLSAAVLCVMALGVSFGLVWLNEKMGVRKKAK